MRATFLLVVVAIAICVITVPTMAEPVDINSSYIQEYGMWAVMEHNRQAHDGIKFKKVVGGYRSVGPIDDYFEYGLIIDAQSSNGKYAKYEASLTVRGRVSGKRTLMSFGPAK